MLVTAESCGEGFLMENCASLSKGKKKKKGGTWKDKGQFSPLDAHIIKLNMK